MGLGQGSGPDHALVFGEFPIDPTGAVPVVFTFDDFSEMVEVGGGNEVFLYGVAYDHFYVSPNGYLTFGAESANSGDTTNNHFNLPVVAAWADDLNPEDGGTISVLRLQDRVVVTYDEVIEDGTDLNSFQIELHYDGAISLAWLNMEGHNGLVGLSDGFHDNDPDFYESDFSEYGACMPRIPVSHDGTFVMPQGTVREITLVSTDDNMPEPASLTTIINTLPSQPLFDATSGMLITQGDLPYTLAANGATLRYEPAAGFAGADQIGFYANDGADDSVVAVFDITDRKSVV